MASQLAYGCAVAHHEWLWPANGSLSARRDWGGNGGAHDLGYTSLHAKRATHDHHPNSHHTGGHDAIARTDTHRGCHQRSRNASGAVNKRNSHDRHSNRHAARQCAGEWDGPLAFCPRYDDPVTTDQTLADNDTNDHFS